MCIVFVNFLSLCFDVAAARLNLVCESKSLKVFAKDFRKKTLSKAKGNQHTTLLSSLCQSTSVFFVQASTNVFSFVPTFVRM